MVNDLTGLGKLADSELVKSAYSDAASAPLKQVGAMTTDLLKTFRLFTAPFQLAAFAQDRFARWLEKVRSQVPEEKQIEASPSIAAPVLRALIFMDDDDPLTKLFLELLKRAIDKERLSEAHPSFVDIIKQLTPDEALILYILRNKRNWSYGHDEDSSSIKSMKFPTIRLAYPQHLEAYILHLKSLNLVKTGEERVLLEDYLIPIFRSTAFGDFFIKACIPEDFSIDEGTSK